MPLYEYEHDAQFGPECQARFESLQRINEEPLAKCPTCGLPCHRVLSSFATGRSNKTGLPGKVAMSPGNLERLGFTQYRRAGGGRYEKTCGEGPATIHRD